jgi:hypothetical protein
MKVIEGLKIPAGNWGSFNIDGIVGSFEGLLGKGGSLEEGNLMARARMTILHYEASTHKGLVIGSGDKSELLMGYLRSTAMRGWRSRSTGSRSGSARRIYKR